MYALSCMPVRTSHACTGPSALLAPRTTSSRKSDTAAIAGARVPVVRLENVAKVDKIFHRVSRREVRSIIPVPASRSSRMAFPPTPDEKKIKISGA